MSAATAVTGLNVEPGCTAVLVAMLYSGVGARESRGFVLCTDAQSLDEMPSAKIFGSKSG